MKRYIMLTIVLFALCINLMGITGFADSTVDVGLDNTVAGLDTPQITWIDIITIEAVDYFRLNWEGVEGANTYKVYASEEPFLPFSEWGEPIATTTLTFYSTPVGENIRRFYRVVASADEE